jgi:hypothetical protein
VLLLRKKFFILNDDVQEAMEGNDVLMELIYQQVKACERWSYLWLESEHAVRPMMAC